MSDKPLVDGKYLMYCDKPFVREKNTICYGDMTDDYVLFMIILSTKQIDGKTPGEKIEVPGKILVQIISTDLTLNPVQRIAKQFEKDGLYEAMDIGLVWLDKLNNA